MFTNIFKAGLTALVLFFLSPIFLIAQVKKTNYDKLWENVNKLFSEKGLTKSALQEVDKIYTLSKKENMPAQTIKALLYKMQLQQNLQQQSEQAAIAIVENDITTAPPPVKNILQSIAAEKYWHYFQQNRWKLYKRSETINFSKTDIATWSAGDFHQKIANLYLASLAETKLLQQTKLEPFDAIIAKGNMRHLRPTLFDMLANRAIDYFKNDERDIAEPAYAFEINMAAAFDPAADFVTRKFYTKDNTALHHKALLIYQQLMAFHLKDANPDALIDADIHRLQFVKANAVMQNEDELYYNALNHIAQQYENIPAAAQAWYLMAQWHADKAINYDALTDTTQPFAYVEAKKICNKVLQQKDSSEGKINCTNLLQRIQQKSLNMHTEKVNTPGLPFRTLISYRNTQQIYLRIIALTDEQKQSISNRYDEDYWKNLVKLKSIKNWQQNLPDTKDYQTHHTEIKIDALPVGNYALLASNNNDFSLGENLLAVQYFYSSSISFINNNDDYFVLDRESGKPLANATVQVWNNTYDYNVRKYSLTKSELIKTDKQGYFLLNRLNKQYNNNVRLDIKYNNDRLFMDDQYYPVYRNIKAAENADEEDYEDDNRRVFFFTDRSIYRPGQTVYFKGIVITKDIKTGYSKIQANFKTKVYLYDVNDEEVDSLELTSNEFGSYNGKFILPANLLNGEFRIEDDESNNSTINFSVEEYKRPKFYTEFEKLKGTFKINDSITITGFAKAYAGNNINGAKVKYRVVRTPRFIYPWLFWGRPRPNTSEMEITNGEVVTDAAGKFNITFKAIPDNTIDKKTEPVFDYEVTADVTDINGETRSAATTVSVSYKLLFIKLTVPAQPIASDSFKTLQLTTQNMAGEFEPASVLVSMYKLNAPQRLIRSRYWRQQDVFTISREAYISNFPFDEYSNETKKETWGKAAKLVDKTDSTHAGGEFKIPATPFAPGWYVIEVTTNDKNGEAVKDVQYILLYDAKTKQLPVKQYVAGNAAKTSVQPGEKAIVNISSAANEVTVIEATNKKTDNGAKKNFVFHLLNNNTKSISYDIAENDRGGFIANYFFVKNNRFYTLQQGIYVPWTNKELAISYTTWRDKTLPGSEERWTVNIKGYKKEKIAAEMLASMYDASLDQFKPHSWYMPAIWPNNMNTLYWNGSNNFTDVQSQEKYVQEKITPLVKNYDRLYSLQQEISLYRSKSMAPEAMLEAKIPGVAVTSNQVLEDQVVVTGYGTQAKKDVASATSQISIRGINSIESAAKPLYVVDGEIVTSIEDIDPSDIISTNVMKGGAATALYGTQAANGVILITTKNAAKKNQEADIKLRTNFNETAFFFPDLKTDSAGNISFSFTMPEALTRWKFQAMAYTKELAFGYGTVNIVTQKDLMVQPNLPRFLRQGDKMELSAKVVNTGAKEITGTIQLELLDATTMKPVDGFFNNVFPNQYFTAGAGKSIVAGFSIQVPYLFSNPIVYRFKAIAGDISDGEEASLPVLTNSILVTETMPLNMCNVAVKNFSFDKLLKAGNSETLQHHSLTVEYTSNPAWYAVQALPYLTDYPYECAEQTFNRYYANALASLIANKAPRLKAIVEKWKTTDTAALVSNLQKNTELKQVLLEETPWVLQAKNETQQKKNIALLFDMVRMSTALNTSFEKLKQMQSANGGFVWFQGGPDDRFITQYILTGLGHLKKLGALSNQQKEKWSSIEKKAITYLDNRLVDDYNELKKYKADFKQNHLGYLQVQYLYMRSFYAEAGMPGKATEVVNYYRNQAKQYWLQQNIFSKGIIALALHRTGDKQTATSILKSLKENAINNEELGMYWKEVQPGYYWHQAPVETQALLIEAFNEINNDAKTVSDLKTWLLKQKQTTNWKTTKATADACYALLLQGGNWLSNEPQITIQLGDKIINSTTEKTEAGTGYFKKLYEAAFVNSNMGNIKVSVVQPANTKVNDATTWGAVYWQYFETLEKITPAATPLQLVKKLFVEKNTDKGIVLQPVNDKDFLKIGDKIKVRIEIRTDRDMEYVHMKDMRASCMEPLNVLSSYKWQGGLGYYETTKDASTNFFFGWLPKGTYVFEYGMVVTHTGNFSNGITTIQSMYAPEFTSHSEGVRVNVE
jgi:TonB-dependent SusC/RagA subfamily outer membrane receptor